MGGLLNTPQIISTHLFSLAAGEESITKCDAGILIVRYEGSSNVYITMGPNYDYNNTPTDLLKCSDIGNESSKKIRVYKKANFQPYSIKNNDIVSHKIQVVILGFHGNQVAS